MHLQSGLCIGSAHKDACQALLWEAHFLRVTGAPRHEQLEVAWQWRRRRAEVEGRAFTESTPTSPAEVETAIALARAVE